jgi:hypothetical protein
MACISKLDSTGRDSTAVSCEESFFYQMDLELLSKVQDKFNHIYQDMLRVGLKKYKKHKILIAMKVNDFA